MSRDPIAPDSLADRIRTAAPADVGGTFASIVSETREQAVYVFEELHRLRDLGYIRTETGLGPARFFWAGPNPNPRYTVSGGSAFYPSARLRGDL